MYALRESWKHPCMGDSQDWFKCTGNQARIKKLTGGIQTEQKDVGKLGYYKRFRLLKRRPSTLKREKEYVHNPVVVGRSARPTYRWAPKAHRTMNRTLQTHCARSSVTNVLSLKQNMPHLTSLSILLEEPDEFWIKWRYRTPSKVETLF